MYLKNGWRPDKPDFRDFLYQPKTLTSASFIDLRSHCPPIWDQKELGSCTAQAIAAALQFEAIKNNDYNAHIAFSRLFIYYNERVLENSVDCDAGAEIRDGIKSVATLGACNESLWWYNTAKFTVKPSLKCYTNAKKYKALNYHRVTQTLMDMQTCLAEGFPMVLGVSCYSSFLSKQTATTGIISMPNNKETLLGGHAILIVGYDITKNWFIFRNSWGTEWGDAGYGYIPFDYLTNNNLCDDIWTIRIVT